jgi:predicted GNAT superfamily acetyltransferase
VGSNLGQKEWQWTIDQLKKPVKICLVEKLEDLYEVKKLEQLVWANDDSVPVHQTLTAVKNGGIVLGSYYDSQLIGFQYSFAGFDGKEAYLCSHTLGIHPDFRIYGIGEKLKWAQRDEAIRKGYRLIKWTYDPLETVNAHLNIRKLGGVSSDYIENCYGDMADSLNAGVPSDRLVVHWWISSDRVWDRFEEKTRNQDQHDGATLLLDVTLNESGLPAPKKRLNSLAFLEENEYFLLPVPAFYQKIKERDLNLAREWRLATREIFQLCLARNLAVVDFIRQKDSTEQTSVHYYLIGRLNTRNGG